MQLRKSLSILNKLIGINQDRIQAYEAAVQETEEAELKMLFLNFSFSSKKCTEELAGAIKYLNETPEEHTASADNFFRVWSDVKAALNCKDRRAILNFCEYGENNMLQTYNDILTKDVDFLTIEQHKMLYKQYVLIKGDHDKVKLLLEMQLEHN